MQSKEKQQAKENQNVAQQQDVPNPAPEPRQPPRRPPHPPPTRSQPKENPVALPETLPVIEEKEEQPEPPSDPVEDSDIPTENDVLPTAETPGNGIPEEIDEPLPPDETAFDLMQREPGETKEIDIKGIRCSFRWYRHEGVMMSGFWIQEKPVTQELWKAVMGAANMREQPRPRNSLPVVHVSWEECDKFIKKLNASNALDGEELKGYSFSLPTEAQWEYAVDVDERVMEWCNDWFEELKNNRVVRGSNDERIARDPKVGYDYVGFRLVIVPRE
jgi:hypothetical protein